MSLSSLTREKKRKSKINSMSSNCDFTKRTINYFGFRRSGIVHISGFLENFLYFLSSGETKFFCVSRRISKKQCLRVKINSANAQDIVEVALDAGDGSDDSMIDLVKDRLDAQFLLRNAKSIDREKAAGRFRGGRDKQTFERRWQRSILYFDRAKKVAKLVRIGFALEYRLKSARCHTSVERVASNEKDDK